MSRAAMEMQRLADEMKKRLAKPSASPTKPKRREREANKVTTPKDDEKIEEFEVPEHAGDANANEPGPAGSGASEPVVEEEASTGESAEAPPVIEGAGSDMAKKAKKAAGKKKAAKKSASPRKAKKTAVAKEPKQKFSTTAIPANAASAKLAEDGIKIEERNRYVNLYFEGGLVVRLQPANLGQEDTIKARDFVSKFLKANLK